MLLSPRTILLDLALPLLIHNGQVYDQESQTWTQSCVCGFTLSFEKF